MAPFLQIVFKTVGGDAKFRALKLSKKLGRRVTAVVEADYPYRHGEDGFSWLHDSGIIYDRFVFRVS